MASDPISVHFPAAATEGKLLRLMLRLLLFLPIGFWEFQQLSKQQHEGDVVTDDGQRRKVFHVIRRRNDIKGTHMSMVKGRRERSGENFGGNSSPGKMRREEKK